MRELEPLECGISKRNRWVQPKQILPSVRFFLKQAVFLFTEDLSFAMQ